MKTKHTSGPWSLPHFADDTVNCSCGFIFDEGGRVVCNVKYGDGFDSPTTDEARVNARLIAAAPEMLDLLMEMFADWKYVDMYADAVRELIEKATDKR